ncbi:MAG: transcriptional regulator GcvA [Lautropia sp.]
MLAARPISDKPSFLLRVDLVFLSHCRDDPMPTRRPLPPLNALRAFEAAARHLSFTAAASELNVTPAAISQQVRRLEDHLGVALFRRLPRGLALTGLGARYGERIDDAFTDIGAATDDLSRPRDETLTICTMPSLATRWLIPRLTSFSTAHPDVRVRVLAETSLADLEHSTADLVIRYGNGHHPGVLGELPFPRTVFPVCSPSVVAGRRAIRTPADLLDHVLLRLDDKRFPAGYEDSSWKRWLPLIGAKRLPERPGPTFSFVHLMIQAAAAGQGIAIASLALTGDDIAAGRLVRPLPDELPTDSGYWLLRPAGSRPTEHAERFRSWLDDEVRRFVGWAGKAARPVAARRRSRIELPGSKRRLPD